jgi:nucleoside-diphosphate-sugar epimerase
VKILVTGGSGFVGQNLVPRLVERGHEVTVLDAQPAQHLEGKVEYEFVPGNVTDVDTVAKIFKGRQFDLVYHLAAIVGIRNYIERPFDLIDVNILGTRNLLHECLARGTRMLFSSTSELFGKNPKIPWGEDDDRVVGTTKVERWAYGNTKAICEHMLFAAFKHKQFPMSIVRYFNLYGPMQHPTNVAPRLVCRTLSNQSPIVYDDGKMQRCFTFIDDAIEGTILAAERPEALGEAFNIGRDTPSTIGELAERIVKLSGRNVKIEYLDPRKEFGKSYEDIGTRTPRVEKAAKVLGWKATTELDEGLRKTIDWYDRNRKWWEGFKL